MTVSLHEEMRIPTVSFTCVNCKETVHEFVDVPNYDYSAEVHSNGDSFGTEIVQCSVCHTHYNLEMTTSIHGTEGKLIGHEDVDVLIKVPPEPDYDNLSDYEIFLSYQNPQEPHVIYQYAVLGLEDLQRSVDEDTRENSTFNRMLFVSYIAVMEAYLCDTLVSVTSDNPLIRLKIAVSTPALREQKIDLKDVLTGANIGEQRVKNHLQHLLYHDLEKVEKLYRPILTKTDGFFPNDDTKTKLLEAVKKRHDCVHRNGKTIDGIEHTDIDQNYVNNVAKAVESLVSHVQARIT